MRGTIDFDHSEILGYTSMVLSFLLVFFGVRSYRDNVAGGAISFGKAFQVGILITLVTCAIYVIAWEIAYFNFFPNFLDQYSAHVIAKMRSSGASDAAILAEVGEGVPVQRGGIGEPFVHGGVQGLQGFLTPGLPLPGVH